MADLHLQASQASTVSLAQRFLQDLAPRSPLLFILGDFVEYWVGDDAGDAALQPVLDELKALVRNGTEVLMMHGNRDFLMGDSFSRDTGITLLREDEHLLEIAGQRVLLMHGDTLCTDDSEYQAMRTQLRSPAWQQTFLSKTIAERRAFALQLRAQSQAASADKEQLIMDVNDEAVQQALTRHQCSTLLHGHTHRPAVHELHVGKQRAQRWVVGDWHPDHAMIVLMQDGVLQLRRFPETPAQ